MFPGFVAYDQPRGGDNRFGRLGRILRRIHSDCAQEINVGDLAREMNMGLSAVHQCFKAITATTPMIPK